MCAICTSRPYTRNYVRIVCQSGDHLKYRNLRFWDTVSRLKPGFVAEFVAGAMAGAPLSKNDEDWVPERSSLMCVCVANMTGKWFLSSMCGQCITSLFYEGHCKGKPGVMCIHFYPPKHLHCLPVLIRKGQERIVSSGKSRSSAQKILSNFMQSSWFSTWVGYEPEPSLPWGTFCNVDIAIINHPCLMVYTTHSWWLGGWFMALLYQH